MAVDIVDPRGSTVIEWTDYMGSNLEAFGPLPRVDDESDWRDWAVAANQFPQVAAVNPPNPYDYEDWEAWAMRFIQSVDLIPTT